MNFSQNPTIITAIASTNQNRPLTLLLYIYPTATYNVYEYGDTLETITKPLVIETNSLLAYMLNISLQNARYRPLPTLCISSRRTKQHTFLK